MTSKPVEVTRSRNGRNRAYRRALPRTDWNALQRELAMERREDQIDEDELTRLKRERDGLVHRWNTANKAVSDMSPSERAENATHAAEYQRLQDRINSLEFDRKQRTARVQERDRFFVTNDRSFTEPQEFTNEEDAKFYARGLNDRHSDAHARVISSDEATLLRQGFTQAQVDHFFAWRKRNGKDE